ncbi:sialate O-acetylesterase [Mucilaginibacter sp. PPCGB 2223]|uniref:sialate O-acetylesterase n=1 Tax=Mucilaginibacter sp. PPCGB 2223 TaxID=1886027 RepID=UPI0008266D28|nr:sialate O-acetylesterase [Mucilaginibacter sp. PPCGB 2223]OCX53051.1 sialate O-acetylesterase [Mucilaginibacter sp. PPCGB 2223]
MRNYKSYLFLALALFFVPTLHAEVVLPRVFTSGMVLQQGQPVPVWGTAAAGEQITVQFAGQTKKAVADTSGKWQVMLDVLKATVKGRDFTVQGTNTIVLHDVVVGEVWLCSGQSNMLYEMRKNSKVRKPDSLDKNSPVDEMDRPHSPDIRLFWVNQKNLKTTGNYLAKWESATQDSALRSFSAAGYFFAKKLNQELKVPVGIICAAISGSAIEPWAPYEVFTADPYFRLTGINSKADGKFYHTMIEPLAPFAIKGFLWYQGEANMTDDVIYDHKMNALINSWRKTWNDAALPFYYVEIVPYYYSQMKSTAVITPESLPAFWEVQQAALKIPNTGMIITTDLNDDIHNLHPPYKWEVGRRLALLALAKSYNKNIVYSGPVYQSMAIKGSTIELTFANVGKGLASKDGKPLTWFSIAGADGKFVKADAVIDGNKVIVSSPEVTNPAAVRFAWSEDAQPNLFNKDGLPAAPFRTNNPIKFSPN